MIRDGDTDAQASAGFEWPNSGQGRRPTRSEGLNRTNWRRARMCCIEPHDDDRVPIGRGWRRWQEGQWQCMRYAEHAQSAVVRGVARPLLRRLRPLVGVTDRNVPDRISADGQRRQRDRGEEKDLAPDGKQRRG